MAPTDAAAPQDDGDSRALKKPRTEEPTSLESSPKTITAVMRRAQQDGHLASVHSSSSGSMLKPPAALFYDLEAWESGLSLAAASFPSPGCLKTVAVRANPLAAMLRHALALGFGAECASMGEVVHAQAIGFPGEKILFTSPCKTHAELRWALEHRIRLNVDSFGELERIVELRRAAPELQGSLVALSVDPPPLAAAGVPPDHAHIGISTSREKEILSAFTRHSFLNGIQVRCDRDGMSMAEALNRVNVAVDLARRINEGLGRAQVTMVDIGSIPGAPTASEYAAVLDSKSPGLLPGRGRVPLFDTVVVECGQAVSAKAGFIASRVEYSKPIAKGDGQIVVVHFGADLCVRQCYAKDYGRQLEFYDGASSEQKTGAPMRHHVAGPLCFQGDHLQRDVRVPLVAVDDFVVMRDAGSNSLSMFSYHCSRQAPAVLGYRLRRGTSTDGGPEVQELVELRPVEPFASINSFWGGSCAEVDGRRTSAETTAAA